MCTRGHWRPAEDEKLRELVERYGPHNWNAIAEKLQGRSGTSFFFFLFPIDVFAFVIIVGNC